MRVHVGLATLVTLAAGSCHSANNASVAPTPASPAKQAIAATAPATQPATVVIKSAPASIDAILAGRKTSTTRKGVRAYALGPAVTTDGHRRVNIEITRIEPKRVSNLTPADATSDGAKSLAAYRAALIHNNPGLTDDDIVSVVHFRVVEPK